MIKEGLDITSFLNVNNYSVDEETQKKWEEEENRIQVEKAVERYVNSGFPMKFKNSNIMELSEFQKKEGGEFLEKILENHRANLWLCGSAGTGKTCLACAISRELAIQGKTVVYIKSHILVGNLKKNQVAMSQTINNLKHCDLVVFDEIGRYPETEWESYFLFSVFDELYDMNKSIIAISNLPKNELGRLFGAATVDRFKGVTKTIEFTNMSYRGKENELYCIGGK